MPRRKKSSFLKVSCLALSGLIIGQCAYVGAMGGQASCRVGRGEIGSNGLGLRYIWTRSGAETIAWDNLLGLWGLYLRRDRIVIDFPLWIVLILSLGTAGVVTLLQKRRGRDGPGNARERVEGRGSA